MKSSSFVFPKTGIYFLQITAELQCVVGASIRLQLHVRLRLRLRRQLRFAFLESGSIAIGKSG